MANPKPIFHYHCGTIVLPGDVVDLDGMLSVVECVLGTKEEIATWGVDEPGILFKNAPLGLVFQSIDSCNCPEIVFIRRAEQNQTN